MEYIYVIENRNNGKFYIGRTNNPAARRRGHFSELRRGIHNNPRLQNSFNKHGEEAFDFKVVDNAPAEQIEAKEAEWFASFEHDNNLLYNCHFRTHGGPIICKPHSPESAAKISEAIKNGTRKYIFTILDERYHDKRSFRYLAKKHGVGANTLLDYIPEWEERTGLKMPVSFQVEGSRERVKKFAELFSSIGSDAMRKLTELGVTRKSLKKYLPEFGIRYEEVLIRPTA